MNPSEGASRDHTPHPSREDGTRPSGDGANVLATDATDAGRKAVTAAGDRGGDVSPSLSAQQSPDVSASEQSLADRAPRFTRASAAWAALVAALLLSVVLIVFVLQNPTTVVIHFLGWSASLAVGMAMLIAAVTGGLLVATIGVARLTQLRVRSHRTRAVPR